MGRPSKRFAAWQITKGQLVRIPTYKGEFTDTVLDVTPVNSATQRVIVLTLDVNGKPVEKAFMADEMVKVVSTHVQDTGCTETKADFPADGSKKACSHGAGYWEHYRAPLPTFDYEDGTD